MPQHDGAGVIQNHAADVEHPSNHIDSVLGAFKAFLQLDGAAVGILHLNVFPRIDVNFLNAAPEDVFGQKSKLRHFGVEGVRQLAAAHAVYRDTAVLDVLGDVAFELRLGILAACGDEGAVMFGDVLLHLGKHRGEILSLRFRGKEQTMRTQRAVVTQRRGFLLIRRIQNIHIGTELQVCKPLSRGFGGISDFGDQLWFCG